MLRFIFAGVARTYYLLARYAPGPRLISRICRRDGLKWGVPAMLVSVPYFLVANIFKRVLEGGGNLWFSVPLLCCLVMGIAFLSLGPISLLLLAKTCMMEAASRWNVRRRERIAREVEESAKLTSPSDFQ